MGLENPEVRSFLLFLPNHRSWNTWSASVGHVSHRIFNIHLIIKKNREVNFAVDERYSIRVPLIAINTFRSRIPR
jgi:hypothetical protein